MSDDEDQVASPTDTENGKENVSETKEATRKVVRVLTVLAYLSSVSMAAIMLSLYYILLWNPAMATNSARTAADYPDLDYGVPIETSPHRNYTSSDSNLMNMTESEEPIALPAQTIPNSEQQKRKMMADNDNKQWEKKTQRKKRDLTNSGTRITKTLLKILAYVK